MRRRTTATAGVLDLAMMEDAHVLTPIGSAEKHLDLQLCPIELMDIILFWSRSLSLATTNVSPLPIKHLLYTLKAAKTSIAVIAHAARARARQWRVRSDIDHEDETLERLPKRDRHEALPR